MSDRVDTDGLDQANAIDYIVSRAQKGLLTEQQTVTLASVLGHDSCVTLSRARAAVDRVARALADRATQAERDGESGRAKGLRSASKHVRWQLNGHEAGCVYTVFDRRPPTADGREGLADETARIISEVTGDE